VLNAAPGTQAQVLLTLNQACVPRGPFGLNKKVTRVALYVDDRAARLEALRR
jgi:hypothetical protein